MDIQHHPTLVAYRSSTPKPPVPLSRAALKEMILDAGADDAGMVDLNHPSVADQAPAVLRAFPQAKTLVSLVFRMNTPQVRSPDRSLADAEFIAIEKQSQSVSRTLIRQLRRIGVSCIYPPEGFPQDLTRPPGQTSTVSHKRVAEAAGMGKIGHHRLLIHPRFGSHLCLGTLVLDTAVETCDSPLDFDPCIHCGLCVAACPTGAIAGDGSFDFVACLVHAYRDRIGGFLSWVEDLVESSGMDAYREKRNDAETLAVWQVLSYGGGYRCGYCMGVCPAGSELIEGYIDRKKAYVREVVAPLKDRQEPVYVLPGKGDRVAKKFPAKTAKPV